MDPAAWLEERGFKRACTDMLDRESVPTKTTSTVYYDFCMVISSNRAPWIMSTALYEAAFAGELQVCRFLFDHGAASTVCTKNSWGQTPMFAACQGGHLDVAKWLFCAGAAVDVRTTDSDGMTPMFAACAFGHLTVAKWLFKVGAAPDIILQTRFGTPPLRYTLRNNNLLVVQWLLLQGAANGSDGHIDDAVVHDALTTQRHPELRACLRRILDAHRAFTRVVLPAVACGRCPDRPARVDANDASSTEVAAERCSQMAALRGHESTLLRLVADYLGIERGRKLRNLREAYHSLCLRLSF